MRILPIKFLAIVLFAIHVSAAELKGIIKTASGEPLPKVTIIYGRGMISMAESNPDGSFSIPSFDNVIFFRHPSYKPITKIIEPSITSIEIVMNEVGANTIVIPSCASIKTGGKWLGENIKLQPPVGAKSKHGFDTDYGYFSISKKVEKRTVWISGINGPMATPGIPHYEWILDAVEFSEHSYKGMGLFSDMRGKSKDGTYWRYIGRFGEAIEYSGLTAKEAEYFDKIIANACK